MSKVTIKTAVKGKVDGNSTTAMCKSVQEIEPGPSGLSQVFLAIVTDVQDMEQEVDSVIETKVTLVNESGKEVGHFVINTKALFGNESSADPLIIAPEVKLDSFELPGYVAPEPPAEAVVLPVVKETPAPEPVSNPVIEYLDKTASTETNFDGKIEFNHEKVMSKDGSGSNAKRMMTMASGDMIDMHIARGDVIRFETNHKSPQYESLVPFNRDEVERSYYLVSQPEMIAPNYLVDGDGASKTLSADEMRGFYQICDTWKVER